MKETNVFNESVECSESTDSGLLNDVFGISLSEEEALNLIKSVPKAYKIFSDFNDNNKRLVLDFMQRNSSLNISSDVLFKHIFDFDRCPDRIEALISSILGEDITIEQLLPNEGIRLNESSSLVIMDIICRDSKGRIINIEMQKLGYLFPGERASCYSADMIMRQYNKLRGQLKSSFQYKDMKPTYLIILMEKSSEEFRSVSPEYFHELEYQYSSKAVVSNLSNIVYISLDTFNKYVHNIDTDRDAWLTFLSATDFSKIIKLLETHPQFIELYKELAVFRQDPERLMNMVSEMIRELDHNTVMYMIDELKSEIEQKDAEIEKNHAEIERLKKLLEEKNSNQ